jgi:hypothetical protein
VTIPSLADPTLAPEGSHVMSVLFHSAPYRLRDGGWEPGARPATPGTASRSPACTRRGPGRTRGGLTGAPGANAAREVLSDPKRSRS